MSFRRERPKRNLKAFRQWCARHAALVQSAGIPGFVLADEESFEDFLWHGFQFDPDGDACFSTDQLGDAQRAALAGLIIARWPDAFWGMFPCSGLRYTDWPVGRRGRRYRDSHFGACYE